MSLNYLFYQYKKYPNLIDKKILRNFCLYNAVSNKHLINIIEDYLDCKNVFISEFKIKTDNLKEFLDDYYHYDNCFVFIPCNKVFKYTPEKIPFIHIKNNGKIKLKITHISLIPNKLYRGFVGKDHYKLNQINYLQNQADFD
jgi:hypothetical protein